MDRMTTKCSTIFVATHGQTRIFHSLEEMPESLREEMLATTRGMNSATILIADKGGREEILKAVQRADGPRYSTLVGAVIEGEGEPVTRNPFLSLSFLGRLLLVGGLGYVLWILAIQ